MTSLSLALAALASVPAAARAQGASYTLSDRDVAVYDLVGTVRVVAGSGDAVKVDVVRRGRDAEKLQVQTGAIGGRQTLRVVFPDNDIVFPEMNRGSNAQIQVRDDGTFDDDGDRGRGHRVRVSSRGSGLEAWADVTVSVPKGQRVAIHAGVGALTATGVDADLDLRAQAASVATRNTRGTLSLDTGSGEVEVRDAQGDLSIDCGSGGVSLASVRGTRLVVDAGSGRLTGEDVAYDRIGLDLGSGGTRLANVRTRDLKLDSGSGSVDIGLAADVDNLRAESGSGSVTLRIPSSLGAELSVDTGSGGIDTDFPITIRRRSRSELEGTIGDGQGRIQIDAGSGSVRLVRAQ